MKFSAFLKYLVESKWFIHPKEAYDLAPLLKSFIEGNVEFEDDKPEARAFGLSAGQVSVSGISMVNFDKVPKNSVLVLPVHGVVTKYGNICMWGMNDLAETLTQASTNKNVIGAVLDIDSGGGAVDGIGPALESIKMMREAGKPVVSWADTMASAAFYIGAATSYIYAQNDISSEFGSIGVMCTLYDMRPRLEQLGYKEHSIYSNLSTSKNQAFIQALEGKYDLIQTEMLDPLALKFQADVKKFRPDMKTDGDILKGKMYFTDQALENKMIDGIGSLQDAVDKVHELANASSGSNTNGKPNSKSNNNSIMKYKTMLAILALSAFEFSDGKVSLSKDHVAKLQAAFEKRAGKKLEIENLSFDAEGYASLTEADLDKIEAALAKHPEPKEEPKESENAESEENSVEARLAKTESENKDLKATVKKLEGAVEKMGENPETIQLEEVDKVIRMNSKVDRELVVSGGFIYGENHSWNKVEATRPWNQAMQAAIQGQHDKMNWFASTTIDDSQLEADLGAFIAGRKGEIMEWFAPRDGFEKIFPIATGVKEGDFFMSVELNEVSQQYQKTWTPKGGVKFYVRKPVLHDIKIDEEFEDLKSIERTWLNEFNREGSDAYKMTFVEYIIYLVVKKSIQEYQIAALKGEYVAPTTGVAGTAMQTLNGLLVQINNWESDLLAKPFDLGEWNSTNILEYVKQKIALIPEQFRDRPGLVFSGSSVFVQTYWEQRRLKEGTMPTYDPATSTIPGHDNIRIVAVPNMGNSKRTWITIAGNIRQLMGERDNNSQIMKVEKSKRVINVFGDYKRAIWPTVVGAKSDNAQALADRSFDQQLIWYNNADVPSTEYLEVDPDATELSVKRHTNLVTPANTGATAITDIADATVGDIIKIKCGALTNASTIANGGNFELSGGDWTPVTVGEILTLVYREDGKFVEVTRDDALPDVEEFTADDATPSVDGGQHFITVDNPNPTAITNLDDAVAETTYYIYGGGGATNTATIADAGNFNLTAAWTATAGAELHLYYSGSKFIEIKRVTP